jgi:hypothetical protein
MADPGTRLALAVYRWAKRRRRDELDKQMRRVRATNLMGALEAVLFDVETAEDLDYVRTVQEVSMRLWAASDRRVRVLELGAEKGTNP